MYKTEGNRIYITRGDTADLTLSLADRAGEGAAFSVLNPYLALYAFKRTA